MFWKKIIVMLLFLTLFFIVVMAGLLSPTRNYLQNRKDGFLLNAINDAVNSGVIEKKDSDRLFYLISKSKEVISSEHPLSDDLADILERFERMAMKEGLSRKDLLVLEKTLEVNLKYVNQSRSEPELFERFFDPSLSFPFVYINGQGFNFHPINALNYATELLEYKGDELGFVRVMGDLLDYLEVEKVRDIEFGVLKFYFAWERESIPWISSISQGIGSAYFALAYSITGETEFERAARLLANSFQVPSGMGGFRIELDYGPFYVEYSNAPFDLVLNGFMLSLKGLWIYSQIIEDSAALEAFSSGIKTLESLLPKYDVEGWSAYSIFYSWSVESYPTFHGMASERYHRLHVRLLYFLGKASGSQVLKAYVEKWDNYLIKAGLKSEIERAKEEYEFWISKVLG